MKRLLAPLVGDAPTVTVVGLCKNAGKTTALNRLMAELEGETLAVTSIGRDGERTDVVTGTEKPEIWVREGTLFATARGMLPLCDVTVEVLGSTDVSTPLGPVGVFRAKSDGYVQLAGPSAVGQLSALARVFREIGCDRVLLDGAAGRTSLAAAEGEGTAILCVGASMGGSAEHIAAETAHVCALFDAPLWPARESEKRFALYDGDGRELELECEGDGTPLWSRMDKAGRVLRVAGGVTTPMLRALSQRGAPLTLLAPDATHFLFDRGTGETFARRGGTLAVERKRSICAVCANPWSAYGKHLDGDELLAALRRRVSVPVVNVKEEWE